MSTTRTATRAATRGDGLAPLQSPLQSLEASRLQAAKPSGRAAAKPALDGGSLVATRASAPGAAAGQPPVLAPAGSAPAATPPAPAPAAARTAAAAAEPTTPRAFVCQCGRPVFFRNSECLACHTPLGYDSQARTLLPLEPVDDDRQAPVVARPAARPAGATGAVAAAVDTRWWRAHGADSGAPRYRRCANLGTAAACNWLVPESEVRGSDAALCRCCKLTRTIPDLSQPNSDVWWNRIELAKRRLVSSLIAMQLPVVPKSEDPERGLAFDLLRSLPGQVPVVTGHADGVITLDVEEADDSWREQRRVALAEPYRTLLGHLRHESGHYYWQRLVAGGPWLRPFREVFGDDRQDYGAALQRHYRSGPPSDWGTRFVSSYASSHPWEDWAETWAHYLHLVDTLDTARSFGLDGERVELSYERYGASAVADADGPQAAEFLRLLNSWMELTGVLNELSRSMGVPDFYPFVLSAPAVRKLYLVHRVIASAAGR